MPPALIKEPISDPKDVPTTRNDPRFSGYELLRDEDGNIVQYYRLVSQPAFWAQRATWTDEEEAVEP